MQNGQPETKEEYIQHAHEVGKQNDIPADMVDEIMSAVHDCALWETEIRRLADYPDIKYLKRLYMRDISEPETKPDYHIAARQAIIGDISGSMDEFQSTRHSKTIPDSRGYYTDDTVLTVATEKAIEKCKLAPNFTKYYLRLARKFPDAGYGGAFSSWFRQPGKPKGYHSAANGCLMRIGPIPFAYKYKKAVDMGIKSCMTTHDHVVSVKAVIIYVTCCFMAMNNYPKEEILAYVKSCYPSAPLHTFAKFAYKFGETFEESTELNRKLPGDAPLMAHNMICCVVDAFAHTNSFRECMEELILARGDTDTACAIAGPLCYAYYKTEEFNTKGIMEKFKVNEIYLIK